MKESGIPWSIVVVGFVIFWPLGLLLLILKVRSDLKATMVASGILKVLAWILIALIGAFLTAALFEAGFRVNSVVAGFLVLMSGALALLAAAVFIKKNANAYRRFISIIVNDGVSSIDEISRLTRIPYEKVRQYLERMISRNFLPNARISEVNRTVVVPRPGVEHDPELEYDIVSCKNCGANKEVAVGRIEACNFCGSKLKAG